MTYSSDDDETGNVMINFALGPTWDLVDGDNWLNFETDDFKSVFDEMDPMWAWYSSQVHYVETLHKVYMNYGESKHIQDFDMKVNDAIMVNAKLCSTCGLNWLYDTSDPSVHVVKDHIVPKNRKATPQEMDGGYERHDLIFVPTEVGKYSILMTESRSNSFEEVYNTGENCMVYMINIHVS